MIKSRIYKILLKTFLAISLLLASVIGLLQIDDDLDPKAMQWISEVNSNKKSDAYYFLMGIFAGENENPSEVGFKLYQNIHVAQEAHITNKTPFVFDDYPNDKKIALPDSGLFCKIWEIDCLKNIINHKSDLPGLLKTYSTLAERYQKFLAFDEYETLSKPMVSEPMLSYQYLWPGHRLQSLAALKQARNGNPREAIDALSKNAGRIKLKIRLEDSIVGKIVFLHMLAENIDLISILAHQYNMTDLPVIKLLNKAERDFERPIKREITMAYNIYQNLDRNSDFWQIGGATPGWVVRSLFKPNMTLNINVIGMFDIIDASHLDQKEFGAYLKTKNSEVESVPETTVSLRNHTGQILTGMATPNYIPYIAKFHDINSKITLLNNINLLKSNKKEFYNIKSPYGLDDKPALSKDGNRICFNGPFEDERYFRCLIIKY